MLSETYVLRRIINLVDHQHQHTAVSTCIYTPSVLSYLCDWFTIILSDSEKIEKLFELLIPSIEEFIQNHSIDQINYLKKHVPEIKEPEQNGEYFWIFRDLDYLSWCCGPTASDSNSLETRPTTLVFSGSPILNQAASHILRKILKSSNGGLFLYFFDSSVSTVSHNYQADRNFTHDDFAHDVAFVITLFEQLINHYSSHKNTLLRLILGSILSSNPPDFVGFWSQFSADESKLQSEGPKIVWRRLLRTKQFHEILWSALEHVLKNLPPTIVGEDTAAVIIDLSYNQSFKTVNEHGESKEDITIKRARRLASAMSLRCKTRMMVTSKLSQLDGRLLYDLKRPLEVSIPYGREIKGN